MGNNGNKDVKKQLQIRLMAVECALLGLFNV